MNTFVITGPSGVGKSQLLLDMQVARSPHDLFIVDPLGIAIRQWSPSFGGGCAGIALDHTGFLREPGDQVLAARRWAEQQGKALILVGESLTELRSVGIEISDDALEIHLERTGAMHRLTLGRGEGAYPLASPYCTREEFIAAARRVFLLFD
ncbi:hypothetical protein [Piscinibacter gummiphilus]|uniref:ATP-binding protein n=1 Tax=Piscinibacter gummiphilus TaxID=946333 RepID=A0ABZ0D222_9BURK|nr:hypothetical protein [Piscinibacter gummiphilus]WOB11289.1 hypothetical protein RXV79_27030 [Piscinibacter gummiphilus]